MRIFYPRKTRYCSIASFFGRFGRRGFALWAASRGAEHHDVLVATRTEMYQMTDIGSPATPAALDSISREIGQIHARGHG
jgi:hypothetical protein